MDISRFNLFSDEELRAIAKDGRSSWHQSLAKAELTRRKQEHELSGKLNQVALEALGAYDSGEDYDSLDMTPDY